MATQPLIYTYQDIVEHLLDTFGMNRTPRGVRQARRAVINAYRDLANKDWWTCYQTRYTFKTAAQSTLTINYDHTGGASERLVTATSGTFPANAYLYRLLIGDASYPIAEYVSPTTVTLFSGQNPGADLTAQTATLYRGAYQLPCDFRKIGRLFDTVGDTEIQWVDTLTNHARNQHFDTPGIPVAFTIRNDKEFYGASSIIFSQPPSEARTYDFTFERAPRPLRYERVTGGTVSVGGGLTTVTGSGTSFNSGMVGSIIRFSENSTDPTGLAGGWGSAGDGPEDDVDNPAYCDRTIMSVTSSTQIEIDSGIDKTLNAVAYVVSDPLDIEYNAMYTALIRMAEYNFAADTAREDTPRRYQMYEASLRDAMAADSRSRAPFSLDDRGFGYPYHLRGWSTSKEIVS